MKIQEGMFALLAWASLEEYWNGNNPDFDTAKRNLGLGLEALAIFRAIEAALEPFRGEICEMMLEQLGYKQLEAYLCERGPAFDHEKRCGIRAQFAKKVFRGLEAALEPLRVEFCE